MKQTPDSGGPAFPLQPASTPDMHYLGMTLRDWFAGQSIHAAQVMTLNYIPVSNPQFQASVAHNAYSIADAMIAARKGGAS